MKHAVSFEQLVDLVEGRLSEQAAAALLVQLEDDPGRQVEFAWLQTFFRAAATTTLASPPAAVRAAVARRYAAHAAQRRPPGWSERLTARLKFDSRLQPATAGVRSPAPSGWQQVYTTDWADIALTLLLSGAGELYDLLGQLLFKTGAPVEVFSVQLVQAGKEQQFSMGLPSAEFVLEAIAMGDYELVITSDHYQVTIPLQLAL